MRASSFVPGQTSELRLDGPAGTLDARLAIPLTTKRLAVVCHPHPLYGGSMTNKVVTTLATALQRRDTAVLRFDFRGVGKSAGTHDEGRGETEDCLTAVAALRQQWPTLPLLLAGFSFGAYISLKAAATARAAGLISIAPPFKYFDAEPKPPHPGCPWLALHSTDDDTVPYADTRRELLAYAPPPQLLTVEGCGHFFHGRLNEIENAVSVFLDAHPEP